MTLKLSDGKQINFFGKKGAQSDSKVIHHLGHDMSVYWSGVSKPWDIRNAIIRFLEGECSFENDRIKVFCRKHSIVPIARHLQTT